ncbi:uncharacterized protein METZ01_LOCUS181655, partial [marine metagenome]
VSDESVREFITRFQAVRDLGWVRSHRANNTGIGKTLEDLMEIDENNIAGPDLGDVEIKSQRAFSSSMVTLFTKVPTGPDGANKDLRDNFGIANPEHPDLMQMHASMRNHWSATYERWGMRLRPDGVDERIYLQIKDLQTDEMVPFTCWYDYDIIREIIAKKMNILAFVSADRKKVDGWEYFHYKECKIFHGGSFKRFLGLMNDGKIQYDIRIGSYKTPGKMYGKVHDHGSGFRIARGHMPDLFDGHIEI